MNLLHKFSVLLVLLALLATSILMVKPAYAAATWTVQSAADDGTANTSNCPGSGCRLRDAIAAAASGDTIIFDSSLTGATIFLASTLTIDKNLTIDGSGLASRITISGDTDHDGTGNVQVFSVSRRVTAYLSDLTITKGYCDIGDPTDAGGIANFGTLTVLNSIVSYNSSDVNGGGIYNEGTLTITNVTFSNNTANGWDGGGIYNNAGNVDITNSLFSANAAGYGGGIYNDGGGVTVTDSTFSGNNVTYDGGGIYNDGEITVTGSTFSGNTGTSMGGGIYTDGEITVTASTFSSNSASYGGGLSTNTAGGKCTASPDTTIVNNTFTDNSATYGGGIYNYNGVTTLRFNTMTANTSGGVRSYNDQYTCTKAGSNIIAGNTGYDLSAAFTTQRFFSLDYNLVGVAGANVDFGQEFNQSHDQVNVTNPMLGALGDNGGPTQTMALLPGSPAIDAGDDSACAASPINGKDQRGVIRPQGSHCDIGAFELGVYTLDITSAHGAVVAVPAQATYYEGSEVELIAIPEAGWSFAYWSGDLDSAYNPASITIRSNTSVTANYTQNEYTLMINSDHGTVAKNPDQLTYHYGDEVQLTALSTPGWSFVNWSGDLTGSGNPASIVIHGDATITANYSQDEYTLSITSSHGTVAKNPDQSTYHYGDVVQLTATPEEDWVFAYWSGGLTGTTNPASVTIHGNTSVTANFSPPNEYMLIIDSAHGTVTKNPDQPTYHDGDVVQLTATPDAGWIFMDWTGDVSSAANPTSVTIHGNVYVTANYDGVPTDIALSNTIVRENTAIGAVVGMFTTTDPDAGDTHTYSFCGGADDASFTISGNQLLTAAALDYETKTVYAICVRTDDGHGGTLDKAFTINVTDIPNVELVAPFDTEDIHTNRPAFRWNALAGTVSYQIQISLDDTFAKPVVRKTLRAAFTSYVPTRNLLPDTTYYWRVRARVGKTYNAWSESWNFTTGDPPPTPVLKAPGNRRSVTGPSPLFDWRDVKAIAGGTFGHYEIQISTDADFSIIFDTGAPTDSQYNGFTLPNGTYYWRVRSVAENGDFSAWSQAWIVRIQ